MEELAGEQLSRFKLIVRLAFTPLLFMSRCIITMQLNMWTSLLRVRLRLTISSCIHAMQIMELRLELAHLPCNFRHLLTLQRTLLHRGYGEIPIAGMTTTQQLGLL
jgi:hypothetical protein